ILSGLEAPSVGALFIDIVVPAAVVLEVGPTGRPLRRWRNHHPGRTELLPLWRRRVHILELPAVVAREPADFVEVSRRQLRSLLLWRNVSTAFEPPALRAFHVHVLVMPGVPQDGPAGGSIRRGLDRDVRGNVAGPSLAPVVAMAFALHEGNQLGATHDLAARPAG